MNFDNLVKIQKYLLSPDRKISFFRRPLISPIPGLRAFGLYDFVGEDYIFAGIGDIGIFSEEIGKSHGLAGLEKLAEVFGVTAL